MMIFMFLFSVHAVDQKVIANSIIFYQNADNNENGRAWKASRNTKRRYTNYTNVLVTNDKIWLQTEKNACMH